MFEGTLGNYTGIEYKTLEQARPYCAKQFLISKTHIETPKTALNKLISKGVQKNNSEWIAKVTNCLISDFREQTKGLRGNHFQFPK